MMVAMHPQQPEDHPDGRRDNSGRNSGDGSHHEYGRGDGSYDDYRPTGEPPFGSPQPPSAPQQRWDGSPDPRPVDQRGGDEDKDPFTKYRAVWVVLITLITLLVAWGLLQSAFEIGF